MRVEQDESGASWYVAILAVGFSRDRGENYVIFGSHIGDGDNKQRLHGTALQAEERKAKQNDISVSRKFGCWCFNKISSQINLIRFVYYFDSSNI